MSRFTTPGRRGRLMTVVASAVVAGAVAAPLAIGANEGSPLKGGQRNGTFTSETRVIANSGAFGTRQSNLGTGGGAIYGCRAQNAGTGCIEASNLNTGQAFNFRFRGPVGGTFNTNALGAARDAAKPFTTNATGVATGLNADRVDGKDAQQIVDEAKAGTKIAVVAANGALENPRGISAATRESEGTYLVTADADITKCAPQATLLGSDATPGGSVTVEPVGTTQLRVRARNAGDATASPATNPAPADRKVSLAVTC